jgi:hypothetical protein
MDDRTDKQADEMILRQAHLLYVRGQLAEARQQLEGLLARPQPPSSDALALLEQIDRQQQEPIESGSSGSFWSELQGDGLRWGRGILRVVGLAVVVLGVGMVLGGGMDLPQLGAGLGAGQLLLGVLLAAAGGGLLFYLWRTRFIDDDVEDIDDLPDPPVWFGE